MTYSFKHEIDDTCFWEAVNKYSTVSDNSFGFYVNNCLVSEAEAFEKVSVILNSQYYNKELVYNDVNEFELDKQIAMYMNQAA